MVVQVMAASLMMFMPACGDSATNGNLDVVDGTDTLDGTASSTDSDVLDTVEQLDTATPEDAVDCSTPNEGCACDPDTQTRSCCLFARYGLSCSPLRREWTSFRDCGCWENPECREPLYGLCSIVYPSTEQ